MCDKCREMMHNNGIGLDIGGVCNALIVLTFSQRTRVTRRAVVHHFTMLVARLVGRVSRDSMIIVNLVSFLALQDDQNQPDVERLQQK